MWWKFLEIPDVLRQRWDAVAVPYDSALLWAMVGRSVTPPAPADSCFARALRTPLVRAEIEALAKENPPTSDDVALALREGEAHAATVLAFGVLAAKRPLAPNVVRLLLPDLPEVPDTDLFGPLAHAAEGGAVAVLTGYLADGRGSWFREAQAFLLLAARLEADATPPDEAVLRLARRFARRQLETTERGLFGAAVARLGNAHLSTLAAKHVTAATRQKRAIEDVLGQAVVDPLSALPRVAGPRIVAVDYTVRKAKEAGRNDPCPCNSGKKYKKCCALKTETQVALAPSIEDSALHPEQASLLKPAQLAKLDPSKLAPRTFMAAYDRVLAYRMWDVATRMFREAETRTDLGKAALENLRVATLHEAFEAREKQLAEHVYTTLADEDKALDAFEMALLRNEADLARVHDAALAALRNEDDGAESVELAFTLLRHWPALGIYVARGALHERRGADCSMLLEAMEDARDKLLVAPFEPWWDLYERMVDAADDRDEDIKQTLEQKKLADSLRTAHKEQRKVTAQLTKLKARLDELDRADAPAEAPNKSKTTSATKATAGDRERAAVDPKVEEERRLLRSKVAELRRIVTEGQEERRELRQKLAEAEATVEENDDAVDENEDDDAQPEDDDDGPGLDAPRNVLVPRFGDRAHKSLLALDPNAADAALAMVSALAAGRPNAWSGAKHLTKVKNLLSARAGLYHRILFAIEERALVVLDVVPRKELEQALVRLAAERGHRS